VPEPPAQRGSKGFLKAAAKHCFKVAERIGTEVQDLLIDRHRELGVGMTEEIHRSSRVDAQLGQQGGECPAQGVRRELINGVFSSAREEGVGPLMDRADDMPPNVVRRVSRPVRCGNYGILSRLTPDPRLRKPGGRSSSP